MSRSTSSDKSNVVDFASASEKHRVDRDHQRREEQVDALRQRFAEALPERKTPVKDFLRKKKSRKKR